MSTKERYCINSVKIIKDKIRMDFTDNGDSVKRDFKQKATPEFYAAITGLKKTALAMMGLSEQTEKEISSKVECYGVTIYHAKDNTIGCSIHLKFYTGEDDNPIIINTPKRMNPSYEYSGDKCLSEDGSQKLDDLIYAVLDYLKGKRAQVALFDAEGNVVEQTKEEPKPKETAKQKSKDKKPTVPVRAEVIDISSLTAETLPN
ncbi:MAG: hypothetical protein KH045_08385 [Megamonas funiformis]|uniref:hypothetical protein n=1 Tax=Megamonas funiformis TaxID=437897 RepID=UPI001ECE4860|nr:hypothetical protein [Megamonas funiformis]MBS7212552.1 hypothetical protein [Megamonas funiformis]